MSVSASAVGRKASSLVVAASMSAVEALKDQAGLCRWDYALRSLYQRGAHSVAGRAVPVSLSSSPSQAGSAAAAAASACRSGRPSRAEEERMHKAYHLVCWGPN